MYVPQKCNKRYKKKKHDLALHIIVVVRIVVVGIHEFGNSFKF